MPATIETSAPPDDALCRILAGIARDPERTRHLHRLLGPYCHESRNILNSLKLSLYIVGQKCDAPPGTWKAMETRYEAVEQLIDRVQQLCRPVPLHPIRLPLWLLFQDRRAHWQTLHGCRGHEWVLEPGPTAVVAEFDPQRLGFAFDELASWRARLGPAATTFRLAWYEETGAAVVSWSEAPGVGDGGSDAPDGEADPFASGEFGATRGPEPKCDLANLQSQFALPVLIRVISSHGGTVDVEERDGWRLRMRWPLKLADTSPG